MLQEEIERYLSEDLGVEIVEFKKSTNRAVTKSGTKDLGKLLKDSVKENDRVIKKLYPALSELETNVLVSKLWDRVSEKFGAARLSGMDEDRLKDLVLIKDVREIGDKVIFKVLNNSTGRLVNMHPEILMAAREIKNPINESVSMVVQYEPRMDSINEEVEIEGSSVKYPAVNSYIPPRWTDCEEDVPDELPEEIEKVFSQVVEEDREFFLYWIYQSLTSRANVYLVMCGDPGIGKNIIKTIIKALHGEVNSVDGKKNTINGQFNGQLQNCTFIHFDEIDYDRRDENIMKELPNATVSIESKNKNSTRSTRIHCSMMLANNKPENNYIAFDGRKFAPIGLEKRRLETIMSSEEIDTIVRKVSDERSETYDTKYIKQIAQWIMNNCDKGEKFPMGEYRGRRFWELAYSSMDRSQAATIDLLTNPEKYIGRKEAKKFKMDLNAGVLKFSEVRKHIIDNQEISGVNGNNFKSLHHKARAFLEMFRDLQGNKKYITHTIEGNITGDFLVQSLDQFVILDKEAEML